MLRRQPVSETNTDPPYTLHAADTRGQFGAQESSVGRLVRNAPDGSQPTRRVGSSRSTIRLDQPRRQDSNLRPLA